MSFYTSHTDVDPPDLSRPPRLELASIEDFLFDAEMTATEAEKRIADLELRQAIYTQEFLPSQKKYLDAVNSRTPEGRHVYDIVALFAGNQIGKSWVHCCDASAESLGYQPWDGTPRSKELYPLALVLRDYDFHARKFLQQNILKLFPLDCVRVERTGKGSPRVIQVTDPQTGHRGLPIYIFTHDLETDRLEGTTLKRVMVDEPCPREHWIALTRGLQKTGGISTFTMTLLEEPWIWHEIYEKSYCTNPKGRKDIFAITAFPEENRKSQGGHLDDEAVERFRAKLTDEEKEARVHGRYRYLSGRIYKYFDRGVHTKPRAEILEIIERDDHRGVWIQGVDPHDSYAWATGWFYLHSQNVLYWVDEWPNEEFYKVKAKNYTYDHYATIYRSKPWHEKTTLWVMDPNFGRKSENATGLTVAENMHLRGFPYITDVLDDLSAGHNAVRARLHYNRDLPPTGANSPRLIIAEECTNAIFGVENYIWHEIRGKAADWKDISQKPIEKWKHFPDVKRYVCMLPVVVNRMDDLIDKSYERNQQLLSPLHVIEDQWRNLRQSSDGEQFGFGDMHGHFHNGTLSGGRL